MYSCLTKIVTRACLNVLILINLPDGRWWIVLKSILFYGPFKCYVTLFNWEFDPHPPPRNADNVEPHTYVTLFSGKADT